MTYASDNTVGHGIGGSGSSVGAALRQLREQRGWSIADVSARLKFAARQIEALENEDWSGLPRGSSLRGFLRNYARLLEIDPEPLLVAVEGPAAAAANARPVPSMSATPLPASSPREWGGNGGRRRGGLRVLGLVLLLIGIGAAYAVFQERLPEQFQLARLVNSQSAANGPREVSTGSGTVTSTTLISPAPASSTSNGTAAAPAAETPAAPAPAATPPASTATPAAPAPRADAATSTVTEPVGPMTPATTPPLGGVVPRPASPQAPAASADAAPAAAATAAAPAAASGSQSLAIQITRDSWIDVRDGKGTVLVSQVLPAGTERTIDAAPPVRVVVGNVQGATLSWQGKPVDLRGSRDNVARLTLQ